MPSTIAGPALTDPPLAQDQSCVPVLASRANIVGSVLAKGGKKSPPIEPAYTTPFATLTGPMSIEPFGSAVCQMIAPVAGSTAPQLPASDVAGVPLGGFTIV